MKHKAIYLTILSLAFLCVPIEAQITPPQKLVAGQPATIQVSGNGEATLYLFGPGVAIKRNTKLPSVELRADELREAGRYTLIVNKNTTTFFVVSGPVADVAFIARPSRVPASANGAVNGSAFLFDQNQNLVLAPQPVEFSLAVEGAAPVTRRQTSRNGVAWVRLDSGRKSGAAQFVAKSSGASIRRVVQQVAADPCNIRMRAQKGSSGNLVVETDPIHDCSGNAVPDGTIVTFTEVDARGRSTVDARIKRGIARAELPASPGARISVAAGVVMGNEIRWGGQ